MNFLEGSAREAQILSAVRAGAHEPIVWCPVKTQARGRSGVFYVSADALKIDGVRIDANAITSQQIANALGCHLNTSRTSDLAWEQAVVVPPCILGASPDMDSSAKMIAHSKAVDDAIKKLPTDKPFLSSAVSGLFRTVGKDWIIHPRMAASPAKQAVNYGWHATRAPYLSRSGLHMWQTVGTRHNTLHVDYSQTLTLVRGDMLVDGTTRHVEDVLRDSELSWLLSDDGALEVTRYQVPGEEVPKTLTSTDELSLAAILRDAHTTVFGTSPNMSRLGVAWAHIALENGRGAQIWCHNYGNITAGSSWSGSFFRLPTKPPDPTPSMKFRAHADHIAGASDYWRMMKAHWPEALEAFDASNPGAAADRLKAKGYYTAAEGPYAAGMVHLFHEFQTSIVGVL